MRRRIISTLAVGTAVAGTSIGLLQPSPASAQPVRAAGLPTIVQTWDVQVPDGGSLGSPIALSSPTVATLDGGGPAAVVGDRGGHIYALHLSNGTEVAGWPASTGGVPVDSAPSSWGATVYAGLGGSAQPLQSGGGYAAFGANGVNKWLTKVAEWPSSSPPIGVMSGMAVGTLQGQTAVVSGSMGQQQDAMNASSGAVLPGFPWYQADSNFTTPAIADVYSNGVNEIVEGGASTHGTGEGITTTDGGHIRILSQDGGAPVPLCEYNTDQTVDSSPAVGEFLSGSRVGIVDGTGTGYPGASDTDQVIALDNHCNKVWETRLDGGTGSSPSLVDALGNGQLQVAEGTASGTVWLLNGATGQPIWRTAVAGEVFGGIASVDLGGGYQDLIVTSTGGVQILDGRTGAPVWSAEMGAIGFQNTALVTDDPNGTIGITVAGYEPHVSDVVHFEVQGSNGAGVDGTGAWPMFHHDAQLTGDAGTPPPVIRVPCNAPPGGPHGYWMGASDGGVFSLGNLPFCGSTGNVVLNRPMVGMAGTKDGGGYWMVASDGGIFTFGDAGYYGSTGNVALNKPIVGMAPTPDGGGYWLVASDGGIFTFGDAKFYGSTGNIALHKPIVGMAATPDGHGYWLVASDGGIFTFGDAGYHGSTGNIALNKPIVGMAATPDGHGYWLVASDGGIFTFGDAGYHGSTGAVALRRPIVGMAPTASGQGYWLFASDGGVFTFGDAPYMGSEGSVALVQPIVAAAAY